jgi:Fic family protein
MSRFEKISLKDIEDIHYLLTDGLEIKRNLRKSLVKITGTKYTPLDNEFQIREALQKTCEITNRSSDCFSKALILMLLIVYIQPFVDGNKRTSRLTGNAVLMAHGACPLSFRSIKEVEYKKAMLLFYEQNNLSYFKKLFMEQYAFSVNNYFLA